MEFIQWFALAFSFALYAVLLFRHIAFRKDANAMALARIEAETKLAQAEAKLAQKDKEPKLDVTAQDLLHDLTRRGGAVLKVEVIDPTNLLLRSPRL